VEEEVMLTKKEKRELAKEQKKDERDKTLFAQRVRKFLVWLFLAGIFLFIGFKTWRWISAPTPEVAGEAIEVKEDDWVRGNKEARVILIEYGDYQCPACATYNPFVIKLSEEFQEDLKIVYRHFPLITIHKNSMPSAQAAEAAGKQSKFWEMHDLLYDKQSEWAEAGDAKEKFSEYAKSLGLDEQKYISDYDSGEVKSLINSDLAKANSLRLNATPTFFLNGEKVQPRSYEDFKSLVETQIKGYTLE